MRSCSRLLAGCCLIALSLMLSGCEPAKPVASGPVEVPSDPLGAPAGEEASTNNESEPRLKMTKEPFGKTADGEEVDLYTLTNAHGMKVKIMTYGAIVVSVEVPDRNGKLANVNLGFDNLDMYLKGHPYFGAIIGRYGNRIAKGKFTLDGKEYTLAVNNGPNHLHGGLKGFDKYVWKYTQENGTREAGQLKTVGLTLHHTSPDGDEGYPGKFDVWVSYVLTDDNALQIHYLAETDKPTVFNLTNHCYWNLAGAGSGDVLKHELTLHCDKYLPVDATQIPIGEEKDVTSTPMDFRKQTAIGARIAQVEGGGYDHCYVVNGYDGKSPKPAARVYDPASGRVMEITTTEPGIQLYTGNGLGDDDSSARAGKHGAFCLETQHYPDSPNQPSFPSVVLKPGEKYQSTTVHRFSVEK